MYERTIVIIPSCVRQLASALFLPNCVKMLTVEFCSGAAGEGYDH